VALPATDGTTVDLARFRGKRNVLLYFYEHAG
jgi:peroxiredoxin